MVLKRLRIYLKDDLLIKWLIMIMYKKIYTCILSTAKILTTTLAYVWKYLWNNLILKHKDSFGKSENLSKIFFGEILVFDHDYEGILIIEQ